MSVGLPLVAAAIVLVLVGLWFRTRRRSPTDGDGGDPAGTPPMPTAGTRTAATGDFYAPAFIVDPGHCFRLCRDPATGAAYPCDGPVEGRGQFADHRGNLVEVEACGLHLIDLENWRFDTVEG